MKFCNNSFVSAAVMPVLALYAFIGIGCSARLTEYQEEEQTDTEEYVPEDAVRGRIIVRVTDELAAELEEATDTDGDVDPVGVKSLSGPAASVEVLSMRRLFPYAGEFEARTKAEGLHLWYVVDYSESVATKAAVTAFRIPGVTDVEIPQKMVPAGGAEVLSYESPAYAGAVRSSAAVFDDPMLPDQWHYFNDGTAASSVSGCDINVVPVWRNYTTGSPDVIVSVVDGGIDYTHEDLAANMWQNPSETGDRRYGYNFVTGGPRVTADDHGTHVAGTIAAVNNNGIGVCGVAGGNSAAGQPGVKLMSCQIFQGDDQGSGAEAIKWGADHGAVISQNSWGYTDASYTPQTLKAAVDYFVKYAGVDANGAQTGPMKGGLVLFAAGNENMSIGYPAEYGNVVAVSSVGADFRRAYYSNYGSWTDIAAPGGDVKKGNQVLSTLPGNRYGRMQGTSMACPHVSGVAALIVSRFGGPGFTVEALKERLLGSVTDISGFNRNYYLGSGLVNAYLAIAGSGGIPPEAPTGFTASAASNNVSFSITVPSDEDDVVPYSIIIYYGTSSELDEDSMFAMFYVDDLKPGDVLSGTIGGLEFETEYYFRAVASDLAANRSDYTDIISLTTGPNSAPVIVPVSGTGNMASLKPHETFEFSYECSDPDGHYVNLELEPGSEAAVLDTTVRMSPKIRITGADAPSGTYAAKLTVTDIYGASSSVEAEYVILENNEPYVVKEFGDMVFSSKSNGTIVFAADEYFRDDDGEQLSYAIDISNTSVLNFTYARGTFNLTTMNYGYTDVTVTGTDVRGAEAKQTFRVLVKDGSEDIDVYPNPVSDRLNLRTGSDMDVEYRIYASSGHMVQSGKESISPFSPVSVDVSGLAGGVYRIELAYDGKESSRTFVKL